MEGFSDGVYGFAATLLVLDLALHPPGTPLEQVSRAWPGYIRLLSAAGGAWPLGQPLRIGPGVVRTKCHPTGQGMSEHPRGGGLELAAQ
jgi:hypothetical protein